MEYQYSVNDHFKFPEKYQMTPFKNIDFLKAYKKSRELNLELFKENSNSTYNLDNILKKISLKNKTKLYKEIKIKNIKTEKLLKFLLIDVIKNEKGSESILDLMIKKFEIKKKLFGSYDSEFKENVKEFSNLKNYIFLSLICLLKFEKTHNLKFLNVSLKLNDLISSQITKLFSVEEVMLYSFIIKKEIELVLSLCKRKMVLLK